MTGSRALLGLVWVANCVAISGCSPNDARDGESNSGSGSRQRSVGRAADGGGKHQSFLSWCEDPTASPAKISQLRELDYSPPNWLGWVANCVWARRLPGGLPESLTRVASRTIARNRSLKSSDSPAKACRKAVGRVPRADVYPAAHSRHASRNRKKPKTGFHAMTASDEREAHVPAPEGLEGPVQPGGGDRSRPFCEIRAITCVVASGRFRGSSGKLRAAGSPLTDDLDLPRGTGRVENGPV